MKLSAHLLLFGLVLLAYPTPAQTRLPPRKGHVEPRRITATTQMVKDGVTMKDGKLLFTELGRTVALDQDKKLLNGTLISTTGVITHPDGTTEKVNEGDQVSLTGRLTTRQTIAAEDSVRKVVNFDLKHPGKRKEMEKAKEKADKARAKAEAEKAKLAEKRAKEKAKKAK